MKKLFTILILMILVGVVACKSKKKCNCSSGNVCVTINNATGKPIRVVKLLNKIIIEDESEELATQNNTCLSFYSPGENSFKLIAILSNGKKVISNEVYSEGGYKFIGTITNDTIKLEYKNIY